MGLALVQDVSYVFAFFIGELKFYDFFICADTFIRDLYDGSSALSSYELTILHLSLLDRWNFFFRIIFLQIFLILSFFPLMEGHFIIINPNGYFTLIDNIITTTTILIQKSLLASLIHQLQILLNVTVENLGIDSIFISV